jgi:hypothetical protein
VGQSVNGDGDGGVIKAHGRVKGVKEEKFPNYVTKSKNRASPPAPPHSIFSTTRVQC